MTPPIYLPCPVFRPTPLQPRNSSSCLPNFMTSKNWSSEDSCIKKTCTASNHWHINLSISVHHICQWQQHHDHLDPSNRERMKITGSSLNQINECIVPILQIWIWNIESTRSMIGLIWVDFVRLRGSFYTSGIRLHQLHLVARWITLANIAWQSCERNKSANSQLFNWYELHWIAIFAMDILSTSWVFGGSCQCSSRLLLKELSM